MWMIAINLLKAYWKPLVIALLIIAWSWYWYDAGRDAVRAEWEAEKVAQVMAIQAEKDRLQDEANKKSTELETIISELKTANRKLNARVKDAIKKNDAYAKCLVDDNGVNLYNNSINR